MKKNTAHKKGKNGRSGVIRTLDLLFPKQEVAPFAQRNAPQIQSQTAKAFCQGGFKGGAGNYPVKNLWIHSPQLPVGLIV